MTSSLSRRGWLDPRLDLLPADRRGLDELRLGDVWSVWSQVAASEGLDAGDLANVRAVAWSTLGAEADAVALDRLPALLDALEADARRRRPMFRFETLADGRLAIVADPQGQANTLDAVLADFRAAAARERRAFLARRIAELRRGPDRPALPAIAPRLGLSLSSANRVKRGAN